MSEDQEIAIGLQQDTDVRKEMGVYADRSLQEYVTSIGLKLAQASVRGKRGQFNATSGRGLKLLRLTSP